MQEVALESAINSIRVRFGSQALTRAAEMPPPQPWSSGTPVDQLTGIGGLPRGRVSLFTGSGTSGKLTIALSLLARATHEFAHAIVVDTLGFSRQEWIWELGQLVGLRVTARCVKNRVAPPLGETELEIRYPLGTKPLTDYRARITEVALRLEEVEPCASAVV